MHTPILSHERPSFCLYTRPFLRSSKMRKFLYEKIKRLDQYDRASLLIELERLVFGGPAAAGQPTVKTTQGIIAAEHRIDVKPIHVLVHGPWEPTAAQH